ncbi:MAG: cell division protein FtsL [Bacillota bacterium]
MLQDNYEYVHGSAARQLQYDVYEANEVYDVYEENKVLREKKRYRSNRKAKLRFVMSIMAVFFAGLAVMYRYAIITKISYDIGQKEKAYNELRNENAMLRVDIETETYLAEIKETAVTRLGMQMPDKSQIVYIKVPRKDYTVVIDETSEERENGSFLSKLAAKAAGLVKLLE